MIKYLFLIIFSISNSASISAQENPNGKNGVFTGPEQIFTYTGFGNKLYCVPSNELKAGVLLSNREYELASAHSPGLKGTLACYQCCVGELKQDLCSQSGFNNWSRGKNCECRR